MNETEQKWQETSSGRALDDLAHPKNQPPSDPERIPFHVLYAAFGLEQTFHYCVQEALGAKYYIFTTYSHHEKEIRLLWTQRHFDCAILTLNNIVTSSPILEKRIERVLALIAWLRERSSAAIIATCGLLQPEIEQQALHAGADRFFCLPFPPEELMDFLRERFGGPTIPGYANSTLGDHRGAIEDYTKAIELDPGDAHAYCNRGVAKSNLKDQQGACQDWKKAGELGVEDALELIKQHCQ